MAFYLIAGRSLAGDRTYSNRHLGAIGSHSRIVINPRIHLQLRQPGNKHGWISPGLISPRTVWKSSTPPTGRSLIGWRSHITEPAPPGDDRVPSPVQRSFYISKSWTNRGIKSISLRSSPPLAVWKPRLRWLKSLIGSSSTAAPHPRRMVEAHKPLGGSSVAHGGDRAPSPVQKSSESLQLQQRRNYNNDLPGRCLPARGVNPDPIGLFVICW